MTEPTNEPQTDADVDAARPPAMPRWVKVSAIVVGVLILVFVILQLAGVGGRHGPGTHNAELPISTSAATADDT